MANGPDTLLLGDTRLEFAQITVWMQKPVLISYVWPLLTIIQVAYTTWGSSEPGNSIELDAAGFT